MGYIKASKETSCWADFSALAAGGRPARSTANGQKFDRWNLGRPARSTVPNQRANALWPIDRSVDRPSLTVDRSVDRPHPRVGYLQSVDRPKWLASVHVLSTSVDRSGRPTLGPVDRSGRPPEPGRVFSGLETWVFIIQLNAIKSLKNPQK